MTPQQMAVVHGRAFAPARGWSADEIQGLCLSTHVAYFALPEGFALARTIANETELLTLAVDPAYHRKGIGGALLSAWMSRSNAEVAFLEVAANNAAALALYTKHGFAVSGRRKGYYRGQDGPPVDAVLMRAALSPHQSDEYPVHPLKTG
ncbi:MAG: GNAT family N-acetyltransferase [Roseobacter sp.]